MKIISRIVPVIAGCILVAGCTITLPGGTTISPGQVGASPKAPVSGHPAGQASKPPASTAPAPPPSPSSSPTGERDWASIVSQWRSSVVRISTATCEDGPAMGSGFVVGENLVMTAAHVVMGTRTLTIQSDQGEVSGAKLIAYDTDTDSALLRTDQKLRGQAMSFSDQQLQQGSRLAALGYPLGTYELRIAEGIVSGLHESVDYGPFSVADVFTTDAATNAGNSGGPVVDPRGDVIGLVSGGAKWAGNQPVQGINYMIPATSLQRKFTEWAARPAASVQECADETAAPAENPDALTVRYDSANPHARAIAMSLYLHGSGINNGSYRSAWTLFTPKMQHQMGSLEQWQSGLISSYWNGMEITSVTDDGGTAEATAHLRTQQDAQYGHDNQTCSDWIMTYTMKLRSGAWLIHHVEVGQGSPTSC